MNVWISFPLVNRFANQLFQGGLYDIEDFYVRNYVGKYKCLNHNKHIIMSHATNVRALYEPHFYVPVPLFEFTDLASITPENFQDSHCIGNILYLRQTHPLNLLYAHIYITANVLFADVVGIIHLRKKMKSITNRNNQEQTYFDFVITDLK